MTDLYGSTRSVVARNYALLTPAGFVNSILPGWHDAQCVVVVAPQMGARFAQLLITLGQDGVGAGNSAEHESFIFVRDGAVTVQLEFQGEQRLESGGYLYLPPGYDYRINVDAAAAQLLVFQRGYTALDGYDPPSPIFGDERTVTGEPFMGDEAALLKTLLPDTPAFDMAVNIFTFQPGATLPIVETHVMEHGLLMIQGQGIYRLDADWHPVQTGDVIWMAPYCPQWFVATGKTPARYIYYKDVNRPPLR